MPPRPKHWHILQAARQEALLAVDLFNRARADRSLEAFVVHMNLAWLHLFHAIFQRDRIDYRYHLDNGRLARVDGQPKTWECARCIEHYLPDAADPIRLNVEFFIGLRNMVEHRYARLLEPVIAGKAQALVRNFEAILEREFGADQSLSDWLRFPVFLSALTPSAVDALKASYRQLPSHLRGFIEDFDGAVSDEVRDSEAYEFKVYMVKKLALQAQADLAVEFVDRNQLTDEQRRLLDAATVMVRDRHVQVANLELLKPGAVVACVKERLPRFTITHHTRAWRHFLQVRPASGAADPRRTDARYCVYDAAHRDYVYTKAWVNRLTTELTARPDTYPDIVPPDFADR